MSQIQEFQFPGEDENGRVLVVIRSEEDAWKLLQHAVSGRSVPEFVDLKFEGWPNFEMKFDGRDWHSTVPTRVMAPLLEVQKDLHRVYANIRYGTNNLRRLKDEERDALELVVEVKPGSSDFMAKLEDKFTELAKEAVAKMSSREVIILLLGAAVVWGSVEVSKHWISTQLEEKKLENSVQMSQEETERLKVFAEAVKSRPVLDEVKSDREASQNRLLKALKPTDKVLLPGVSLQGAVAAEITHQERARASREQVEGVFRILANDASKVSGFRIKVQRLNDGEIFSADVPLELSDAEKNLIQQAEWSKGLRFVRLNIECQLLRGKIVNAVVYGAAEVPDNP